MIYSYTKCESVIAKVMADLNMSEKDVRITDIREWIFEAVDKIGAPTQYIQKESGVDGEPLLKIEDYQVPIPVGLYSLDGVAFSTSKTGQWSPMRTETALFKDLTNKHHCHATHNDDQLLPEKINTTAQLYTINGVRYLDRVITNGSTDDLTYFIKPGWIVTNRKTGYLKLSYKKIATDERGYPLIPDKTSYQEAVYWYVVMKLSFPKYLSGRLGGKGVSSAQNTFFYIQQQWNFYRNQAYAECMMPTEGELRSIKNDWNKLIPDYDSDDNFFGSSGKEQIIYNDYYYGY